MKKEDVPFYNDPEDFEKGDCKFPCDTQYMVYDPMLHRYTLTADGLNYYGIDAETFYASSNPNKIDELVKKTSKKVYDYIHYKAGRNCYQIMLYRIATAPKVIYPDQYSTRKQFEEALAEQARKIVEIGDAGKYENYDLEKDYMKSGGGTLNEFADISAETKRSLETLGLTKWFKVGQFTNLDISKY